MDTGSQYLLVAQPNFFWRLEKGSYHLSPAGMFGGKAPPRLAAQKSRPARAFRAYAMCACLLSLQMGSIN